jgi:hypothetical protein
MKMTIESEWKALLTEMRIARKHGVLGIGARVIANVERKLETIRRRFESGRAVAPILLAPRWRSRQARQLQECGAAAHGAGDPAEHLAQLIEGAYRTPAGRTSRA